MYRVLFQRFCNLLIKLTLIYFLKDPFSPAKQDMFSPPPLERYEPPQQQQQQAEVAPQQVQPEPAPLSNGHGQPGAAPTRNAQNGFQNGFTEFVSSSTSKVRFLCCVASVYKSTVPGCLY